MKCMIIAVSLTFATGLPALSQAHSAYLEKAERDALIDLCSQKGFADSHAEKCEGVKADVELKGKQREEEARQQVQTDAAKRRQQAHAAAEQRREQQEEDVREQTARDHAALQEARNAMPHDGKATVSFSEEYQSRWYLAVVHPAERGVKEFLISCSQSSSDCKQLGEAKEYVVKVLPDGGLQIIDPTGTHPAWSCKIPDAEVCPKEPGGPPLGYSLGAEAQAQIVLGEQAARAEAKVRSARQQTLKSLGLHVNQTQAQVKAILQQHGFNPWTCQTQILSISGFHQNLIGCGATKHVGPGQENLVVMFKVVPHQRRDEDTGVIVTEGASRLLFQVKYAHQGDEEETVWNDNF